MSVSGRSFQDAVRRRQQSGFVARTAELTQFRANLGLPADGADRQFIFAVHGDGGVGKSFLLNQWREIARTAGAVTCWVDEPVFGVPDAMRAIAADLARQGADTDRFVSLLDGYHQRRFEAESDPDAPSGLAAFMTQTAVRMGVHAARVVPGVGGLADAVNVDALAAQADQLRVYLTKKFRRHEDLRLLLSPLDVLTPALVRDLARATRRGPLALFFDTYEQTGLMLDGWLRSVLDGAHGDLPENLVITIAGRGPLNQGAWAGYLPVLVDVPLAPFTDAEARQFLADRGITDNRIAQVIIGVSGRLPLLLATLAKNHPTDPDLVGDPTGDAVERFLKWETDAARRALAVAAALPRLVNEDVLGALLDSDDTQDKGRLFAWLRSMPFITDSAGRCQYHDVVRAAMVRLERQQSPARWKERHRALAAAYRSWRIDQSPQDAWGDPAWRALRLEEGYHLLCGEPGHALPGALADVVRACAEHAAAAAHFAQAIAQAGEDADADTVQSWGHKLEEALRPGHDEATAACLAAVLAYDQLPLDLVPFALRTRGRALYYLDRDTEALAELDKAVALSPDDATALAYRGATHLWLNRTGPALDDLDRAVELDPGSGWAIARRGETYRQMGRYEQALPDFDRAIELNPADDWALAGRGHTYENMGRYENALADLNRAIELDPRSQWAVGLRIETYWRTGRLELALADLDRAIELDPGNGWAIACRGETYRLMGRYQQALADFDRAIELDKRNGWAIACRGQTYRQMGRYEQALDDLNCAIEVEPTYQWMIDERIETYREAGRHDEVLAELDRAIELAPADHLAIGRRGQTYRMMGRYDQALADFDRAIELEPRNVLANAQRGETYRRMGRYDQALADFDRAIELDAGYGWAIASRGQTYRQIGQYEQALADLERALALDSGQGWVIGELLETWRLAGRLDQELADLQRAIELAPADHLAIGRRGQTYRMMGRYEQALADFDRAIELEPTYGWAIGRRGETYRLMGRYEQALADLDRAIELNPADESAIADRGETYRLTGRYEQASPTSTGRSCSTGGTTGRSGAAARRTVR